MFASLKAAYREQVNRLEREGVNIIGKEHFTSLYSLARETAFTPKNIKAGFAASGLFPLNPDKVLRSMPISPADPAIPRADEVKVGSCRHDVKLQTPVTPVSTEALMSLQDLIIQRDAYALGETSKQNLQRHVRKFVKAAQTFFANSILKDDQIQFLTTINNEAKVRRSTKSLVLGKAKVMSYEDLEEARAKRVVKESTQAAKGKGKRGRKRKSGMPKAEEGTADTARDRKRKNTALEAPEPRNKMACISKAPKPASASGTQVSGVQVAEKILR